MKRIVAAMITILTLIVSAASSSALATSYGGGSDDDPHNNDGSYSATERSKRQDPIWQGLCVGASLDLSAASEANCARQLEAARRNRQPAQPPNIEAGLCVGASLDLSLASQAKCVHATQSQPQPHQTPSYPQHKPEPPPSKPNHQQQYSEKHTYDYHEKHTYQKQYGATTKAPKKEKKQPAPPPRIGYAALGDSIAAGLDPASTTGSNPRCGRSSAAYPYAVAKARDLEVTHLACSGATMGDLLTTQHITGPNMPPQLKAAFAGGTPQLITITAGANDIRWNDLLRRCYAGNCGTERDQRVVNALLEALNLKARLVFRDIEQRSNGAPPEVIITGYYNPLSARCTEIEPRITLEEIQWLDSQTNALNQALQDVSAQHNFATFVPLNFTGHDACSNDPWIQGINDAAPFHPTAEGQRAIARAIL